MKMIIYRALLAIAFAGATVLVCLGPRTPMAMAQNTNSQASFNSPLAYPKAERSDHVDDYHGVKVADPYRWLEDLDSPQTREWIAAENKLSFSYLEQIPEREKIKQRITALWNYEKYGVPWKEGGRYFYSRNTGLQNQNVLYTLDSLNSEARMLLDPNGLSADGTVALSGIEVSDNGKLMAYGLASSGSDWNEWKVRDVATGHDLSDDLKWVKFSGASWSRDSKGFFYSRYDEPKAGEMLAAVNYYQKLYYHRIGTPQSEDVLVYERPDEKEWMFGGSVTEDGAYLIISIAQGTEIKNRVYFKKLGDKDAPVEKLIDRLEARYNFIGNDGPVFWFHTDRDAPRGRVIAIDTRKPDRANWKEIVPQGENVLENVSFVDEKFIVSYLKDAHTQVKIYGQNGKFLREIELPGIGTASGFTGKRKDKETFYSYTGFTTPGVVYRYDMRTGESSVFRQPKLLFNPADYETKQVFYQSKDGTRVPMFLNYKKGLKLDGNNPTYLYGYGGFDISLTPAFSPGTLAWMEMGGVFAEPNLRGGGEYGEEWHQGGMKAHKQNVFDDFISAAEWLISNRYTSTPRLAISGGSNGGLLVGACLTERPDLFGAALPAVGVMDMLRFQKFTIGWAWASDYGSSDNPDDFKTLRAYSPLHNIKPGTVYPPTLITTADHDDRVFPAHSFKFAATLQAAQGGPAPILIRIETKAGHGAGKPTSKVIDELADRYAFLVHVFRMQPSFMEALEPGGTRLGQATSQ